MRQVIFSPLYACAKPMFTPVFTNENSDTFFRTVSFSRFLFITCTRDKTFSEEMEEHRRDMPADSSYSPSLSAILLGGLSTLNS